MESKKTNKVFFIFTAAFLLNWVWENAHAFLYIHYQGGQITQLILLRAAFFDAIFITLLYLIFLKWKFLQEKIWLALIIGFVVAVLLEWYALGTGRWAYSAMMPVIPVIKVGLTPGIQLGLLSYFLFKIFRF